MNNKKWNKYKLGELCDVGSSKRIFKKEYTDSGILFYRSKEIIEMYEDREVSNPLYISEKRFLELKKKFGVPSKGDILLTSVGTIGVPYQVQKDDEFYFKDGNLTWIKNIDTNIIDKNFLFYWIKSPIFKDQVNNNLIGSVQKALTIENIKKLEITVPPLNIQKKIIFIVSNLENKIKKNNRINQNLEELAQTLYHQWFVAFEFPNDEGKPYKTNGGEMIDSELGKTPKGWNIKSLSEILEVKTGKKNANIRTDNGKYKFFTCSKESCYTDDYSFDTKAILIAGNGAFYVDWYRGKFEAYQRNYVLEPNNDYLFFFLYMFLKEKIKYFTLSSKGSIVKFITKDMLDNLKFAIPNDAKMKELANILNPIFDMIENNKKENDKLIELRDSLLPFLMNGKVTVK